MDIEEAIERLEKISNKVLLLAEKYTEANFDKEIEIPEALRNLLKSFNSLDSAFFHLQFHFLLIPIETSKQDIESLNNDYKKFMDQTVIVSKNLKNEIQIDANCKNKKLVTQIQGLFNNSKKDYDSLVEKKDEIKNEDYKQYFKLLEDAYCTYEKLSQEFNKIINF